MSHAEMAASIAHEVHQPLSAMLANGQACLNWFDRAEPDLAAARRSVEHILVEGARAAAIIANLRRLACGSRLERQAIDINPVVRSALSHVREIEDHGIRVTLELTEHLPRVSACPIELEQVIANLVTNAAQALARVPGRRRLTLVTRFIAAAGEVAIDVRDNGPGFAAAQSARLFEPFHTTREQGMGMGLALCRRIVSGLGGRLDARPNDGGPGACFTAILPVVTEGGLSQ